jgi:hypothetical protein
MDDAKLALETLVVGLFGLVWILVFMDLLWPSAKMFTRFLRLFSRGGGASPLVGLLVLPVAYVIGSVEFPLADRLFNSDHRLGIDLPVIESDDDIKAETYLRKGEWVSRSRLHPCLLAPREFMASTAERLRAVPEDERSGREEQLKDRKEIVEAVRTLYDYQKFVVLHDESGYRLLKPLYDQVVILRGTAFNAAMLSLVCVLGVLLAWWRESPLMRSRYYVLLPVAVVTWGASAYGLMEAEREFDKHILGAYYAMRPTGEAGPPSEPVACRRDRTPGMSVAGSDVVR